jgi:hypothetical protein
LGQPDKIDNIENGKSFLRNEGLHINRIRNVPDRRVRYNREAGLSLGVSEGGVWSGTTGLPVGLHHMGKWYEVKTT